MSRALAVRLAVLVLGAAAAAGCASDAPPIAERAAAAEPAGEAWPSQRFEGAFSGVSVGGDAYTRQSQGFHRLAVPPGDLAVVVRVAWSGSATAGVAVSLSAGDATWRHEWESTTSPVVRAFAPGEIPGGEVVAMVNPGTNGLARDVRYVGTLAFETNAAGR